MAKGKENTYAQFADIVEEEENEEEARLMKALKEARAKKKNVKKRKLEELTTSVMSNLDAMFANAIGEHKKHNEELMHKRKEGMKRTISFRNVSGLSFSFFFFDFI